MQEDCIGLQSLQQTLGLEEEEEEEEVKKKRRRRKEEEEEATWNMKHSVKLQSETYFQLREFR